MIDFHKLEAGGAEQFTIVTSVGCDAAPLLTLYDWNGTLVFSGAAATSDAGQYYKYATIPNSPGLYRYQWDYAIDANSFILRGGFEAVLTSLQATSGYYCNANDVRNLWSPLNESDVTNIEIDEVILDTQNEINAILGQRFTVPFSTDSASFPPIVGIITKNLALAHYAQRRPGDSPSWVEKVVKKYESFLSDLAAGSMYLVGPAGAIVSESVPSAAGQAHHNMSNYVATFNMLDDYTQRVDVDLLSD